jgi:hypothetical protein
MIVEKLALFSRFFMLACKCEKVDLKFEQGFSNHACLLMWDCEVLSYHFESLTNENNHLITFND